MDSEQCWERTHSWGDEDPDPDWEKAIEEIQAKGRIPMEELRDELTEDTPKPVFEVDMVLLIRLVGGNLNPKDTKFFTRLKRRLELGGSEPIGKMSDLIPKRNRSKPIGFGKVSLGKLTNQEPPHEN